jgi:hypothetical protein
MKLYAALGAALLYAGPLPETADVWAKTLRIAESVDDSEYQLRALLGFSAYSLAFGNHRAALGLLERLSAVATK